MLHKIPDDTLRRYLLGELPEEEQFLLEERFLADRVSFSEVEASERDLIDEYVRGDLSAGEHEQFEKLFLASEQRRQKVVFAQTLKKSLENRPDEAPSTESLTKASRASWLKSLFGFTGGRPAFGFAMAAAALLLLIVGVWLATETFQLRRRLAQVETARQATQAHEADLLQQITEQSRLNEDLNQRLQREQEERMKAEARMAQLELERTQQGGQTGGNRTSGPVATFLLLSGSVRSGQDPQSLAIPPGAQTVRLQLSLDEIDAARSFAAEVRRQSVDGEVVWKPGVLKAVKARGGRAVILSVPARLLPPGPYVAVLLADSGDVQNIYPFSVR